MALRPATNLRRVLDMVRRAVRTRGLWSPGQRVLLACSGGADSLAALELLRRLQPSLGHQLCVGHVDHGLWPGSAQAGDLVRDLCLEWQVPCRVATLRLEPGPDLEARARHARYEALRGLGDQLSCERIATAHHADDQAETFLLRAARGSGLEALEGIRSHRSDGVVRPLLDVPRAWLAEVVQGRDVARDPSNADLHFSRNRLRHQVLPVLEDALPGASAGLARTAALLAEHGEALRTWVALALEARTRAIPGESHGLQVQVHGLPTSRAVRTALLRHVALRLGVAPPGVRAGEQFCAFLDSTARVCTVRGLQVQKHNEGLHFHRQDVAREAGRD